MKWQTKYKRSPSWGDTRIRRKFFFFPKDVNGCTYWLTLRRIRERYCQGYMFGISFWFIEAVLDNGDTQ